MKNNLGYASVSPGKTRGELNLNNEEKNSQKKWSDDKILELWPQANGELRGFQRALEARSGITAAQLDMALQLANEHFEKIKK